MDISRSDQKEFAKEIIVLAEGSSSPETIESLRRVVTLLVSWAGEENSIAVNLSEYINELKNLAQGDDSGWAEEFKRILSEDLSND